MIAGRNSVITPRYFAHEYFICPNINYSSAKMMFLKRCAGSSLSNISQAPYTNPNIHSWIKSNTHSRTRKVFFYPITLFMIGERNLSLCFNKIPICELTESQMRKTIIRQEPITNYLPKYSYAKIIVRKKESAAALTNFTDSQYNSESVNTNHHSMYSNQR